MNQDKAEHVRDQVREGYTRIATQSGSGCCTPQVTSIGVGDTDSTAGRGGGCCTAPNWSPETLASTIGYSPEQLATLPDGANMGLSCGNPTAIASLKPGEVVLDLGSGGGFDVFLAGPKVGEGGRAIGVDMTPAMVSKARANVAGYRRSTGLDNVEFRLGEIEHLPVADASVDVVISNCVLNLSPDKAQVWREIARVLAPGGRVAVSDLALLRPLPERARETVAALVGCVAGAAPVDEVRQMMEAVGLVEITLTPRADYVAALTAFNDPLYADIARVLPAGTTAADFITSLDIVAHKPA